MFVENLLIWFFNGMFIISWIMWCDLGKNVCSQDFLTINLYLNADFFSHIKIIYYAWQMLIRLQKIKSIWNIIHERTPRADNQIWSSKDKIGNSSKNTSCKAFESDNEPITDFRQNVITFSTFEQTPCFLEVRTYC